MKRALNLPVALVEASGIELKKAGKDLVGRCPFHEEDPASLVVTPAKNLVGVNNQGQRPTTRKRV
ncbi:MAG: hypothetical protein E6R00_01245 [Gammaproteobacteria bacterium]|nr:MAG: hypothetical protein E6R00_01245 [Gammaproteobacteria bacterium]